MSLPLFIYDLETLLAGGTPELPESGEVRLSGPEGRHAVSVKRIAQGERILLSDGHGSLATVLVTGTSGKDALSGQVEEITRTQISPTVTVFQALPKAERSELAVDLLTQGGADEIVAFEAERCVAKWVGSKRDKGLTKWRQAAIAAAKQSRRATVPQVTGPMNTAQVAAALATFDLALILHEEAAVPIRTALSTADVGNAARIAVIIGPEGGLSAQEVAVLQEAGATAIKLGPEVLRTATAGLAALAVIGAATARW